MPDLKVFDSWAILAWLLEQPGAAQVVTLLQQAEQRDDLHLLMSWMNVGEVYYMATRKLSRARAEAFLKRLPNQPTRLVLPEVEDFIAAAKLKSTRPISYAQAFAELREMADVVTVERIGAA